MHEERESVRCPVCGKAARIQVDLVVTSRGHSRRQATLLCASRCEISQAHALRLADPMAC